MLFDKVLIYSVSWFGLFTAILFLMTFFENRRSMGNPKPKKYSKVTFAVPMFNVENHLRKTVDSLLALDWPKDKLEIIIVDDGSKDNSLRIAKEYLRFSNVQVLHQNNSGKCAAINFALKNCNSDFFGVLDVDAFVTKDFLKRLMGFFNDAKVMAVTPSIKVYGAKNLLQRVQHLEFLLGVYLRKVFAFLGSIHVTPGCGSIYRKSFFDMTGPYKEGLTEDIELAFRIQSHNYKIENSVDANVYTLGVGKFKPLLNQRLRWYKGFLDNTFDYKFIFGRNFGNLGIFILPSALLSIFVAVIMSVYSIVRFLQQSQLSIMQFINTNFDISQFFWWNFDPFFFNVNGIFLLAICSVIIAVTTIVIAQVVSKERQPFVFSLIIFTSLYLFLFAFWWVGAVYHKIAGKKIRWGNRYM